MSLATQITALANRIGQEIKTLRTMLSAVVTTSSNGLMIAADKVKLDTVRRELHLSVTTPTISGTTLSALSFSLINTNTASVTVSWGQTLPNAPVNVQHTLRSAAGAMGNATTVSVSATGCVIKVANLQTAAASFVIDIVAFY